MLGKSTWNPHAQIDLPTDLTNGPVSPRAYGGGRDAARQERILGT
jgi:hypothetical protein